MRYQVLLIDNDNTLMDFHAAEAAALRETLIESNLPADDKIIAMYSKINDDLWKALERGEVTQSFLKTERFRLLLESLKVSKSAIEIADLYSSRLGNHAELMPGAEEFLQQVSGRMKVVFLSNGVGTIQRNRLAISPIKKYFNAIVISGEIGIAKPDPRIIEYALSAVGCTDKSQAVLVGDSLTADIACANNAGIASIWVHPNSDIKNLNDVLAILER